jgi:hypothetical protein
LSACCAGTMSVLANPRNIMHFCHRAMQMRRAPPGTGRSKSAIN